MSLSTGPWLRRQCLFQNQLRLQALNYQFNCKKILLIKKLLKSKKYVLPDSMKGQTPEPTEDLSDLLVKVPCPEVEVIGSISDSKPKEVAMDSSFSPGSSFCGTVIPSKHLNEQEDVSGGVEGL